MPVERVTERPEGGWGWMCVIGSGIVLFTAGGIALSFSVLFQATKDRFNASVSDVTAVYVALTCLNMLSSPFVSAAVKKFRCRKVAMCGGVLGTLGLVVASQSSTLTGVFIGFGLMTGLGTCMQAVPSYMTVNMYFEKRRGRVMGVVTMMAGVSGLIFPPMIIAILAEYGFPAAMFALAAFTAQGVVAGALFRSIEIVPSLGGLERGAANDGKNEEATFDGGENSRKEKASSDDVDASGRSTHHGDTNFVEKCGEDAEEAGKMSTKCDVYRKDASTVDELAEDAPLTDPPCQTTVSNTPKHKLSNDDCGSSTSKYSPLKNEKDIDDSGQHHCAVSNSNNTNKLDAERSGVESGRESLEIETVSPGRNTKCQTITAIFLTYFDLTILKLPIYTLTTLQISAITIAFGVGNIFLAVYAADRGFTKAGVATLVALRAALFIVFNPLSGVIFDNKVLRNYRSEMYATLGIMGAVCTLLSPLAQSQISVYIIWVLISFFVASALAQETVVIADTVPQEKFLSALGLIRFIRGIISLVGNMVAGVIVDHTGSYDHAYVFGGICLLVCAVALQIANVLKRRRLAQNDQAHSP